jgi:hypothetical protein
MLLLTVPAFIVGVVLACSDPSGIGPVPDGTASLAHSSASPLFPLVLVTQHELELPITAFANHPIRL